MAEEAPDPVPRRETPSRRVLTLLGTLAIAAATALIVNLVNKGADHVVPPGGPAAAAQVSKANSQLISYSSVPTGTECSGGTFLPEAAAKRIVGRRDFGAWSTVERAYGAAPAGRAVVEASIQGESIRAVTLTGITFQVRRLSRPTGVVVAGGCGGPTPGRGVEVNLDSDTPRVVASNSQPQGMVGSPAPLSRPIIFPWKVSLTEPLQLYIFAETRACYCEWRAAITWASGAQRGVIEIPGSGYYRVVGGSGLPLYVWDGRQYGWTRGGLAR